MISRSNWSLRAWFSVKYFTIEFTLATDGNALILSSNAAACESEPAMVTADWIKPGATVIDVGINRIAVAGGGVRLVGDVDFDAARHVARAITPVPGGVGPMTIACLLRNTLLAASRRRGLPDRVVP